MAERWKHHICGWLLNGRNNPLHIVKFEDLKENTLVEVVKVVDFYGGTKVPVQNINSKINYNQFYRNHTDAFNHFTSEQEKYISETIVNTMGMIKEHYKENSAIMTLLHSYVSA